MAEAWVTDEDLRAAYQRFAAQIPGLVPPAAYGVARADAGELTFGHVNRVGAVRLLPAVVLAASCGYTATTAVFSLAQQRFRETIERLAPAEAAVHLPHPNLWSWRELLAGSDRSSTFRAFFVVDLNDPVVDEHDAYFRQLATA